MANKKFYFPGAASTYTIPAGTLRLEIGYPDSVDSSTDVDIGINALGKLRIPVDVDISQNKMRYATMRVTFIDSGTLDSLGVLNSAHKKDTYLKIWLNGSVFWDGLLIWENTRKKGFVYVNGGVTHTLTTLEFVDRLSVLADKTLTDVGYSAGMTVEALLSAMATQADLTLHIPQNYTISEKNGRVYGISSGSGITDVFRIKNLETHADQNALNHLKKLAQCFGALFYSLDGKLVFSVRNNVPAVSLNQGDVFNIEKQTNYQSVRYVEFYGTQDWGTKIGATGLTTTYKQTYGTQDVNDKQNYIYNLTGHIDNIYIDALTTGNAGNPASPDFPDTVSGNTVINYASATPTTDNFYTSDRFVETGMRVYANRDPISLTFDVTSVLTDVPSETQIVMDDTGTALDDTKEFQVDRLNYPLYKIKLLVDTTSQIYKDALIDKNNADMAIKGVQAAYKSYTLDGVSYIPRAAEYDLERNATRFLAIF